MSCLWEQEFFSPKKWLGSVGKEKHSNLKEGQILQVAI